MLAQIITENGQKKIIPLTADAGAGNPVGTIIAMYKKSNPSGFLYLDGRDTTGTSEELSTHYPLLYAFLGGTNKLPDLREVGLKGAEKNTTYIFDSTETDPRTGQAGTQNHDVFTQGEFKDDQIQKHWHYTNSSPSYLQTASGGVDPMCSNIDPTQSSGYRTGYPTNSRYGDVTRGKSFAVYFYIKATSGLSENAQDNVVAQLNEERSYSTEEVNTGKKWIDGKPIYRKVTEFNNEIALLPNTWTQTEVSAVGKETITYIAGINPNGTYFPIAGARDQGNYIKIMSYRNDSVGVKTLIVEYTKTT